MLVVSSEDGVIVEKVELCRKWLVGRVKAVIEAATENNYGYQYGYQNSVLLYDQYRLLIYYDFIFVPSFVPSLFQI